MVTIAWLQEHEACASAIERVRATFGRGPIPITPDTLRRAAAAGLDLNWLARKWLPAPLLAKYERQEAPLRAKYERQRALLWAKYERQKAPLLAKYERQEAPLLAKYERQRALLWAEYERQEAPLRAKYERQRAEVLIVTAQDARAGLDRAAASAVMLRCACGHAHVLGSYCRRCRVVCPCLSLCPSCDKLTHPDELIHGCCAACIERARG